MGRGLQPAPRIATVAGCTGELLFSASAPLLCCSEEVGAFWKQMTTMEGWR